VEINQSHGLDQLHHHPEQKAAFLDENEHFRTHMFSLERRLAPPQDHSPSQQSLTSFFCSFLALKLSKDSKSAKSKLRLADAQKLSKV